MSEPSIISGDGDSDIDEVDQIRATPAPSLISDRPAYKRKESDWKIESVPKRAKHEQSHIRNDSRNLSTGASSLYRIDLHGVES